MYNKIKRWRVEPSVLDGEGTRVKSNNSDGTDGGVSDTSKHHKQTPNRCLFHIQLAGYLENLPFSH
jgi:hypothetical protein